MQFGKREDTALGMVRLRAGRAGWQSLCDSVTDLVGWAESITME